MRLCGACRKPLRWDESYSTSYLHLPEPGSYQCCPRCLAAAEGVEPPSPRRYPPGQVPRHPLRDDYLPICGLCREALFEGEKCERLRLFVEDLAGTEVEPGGYEACPRCLDRWRPIVRRRLIDLGLLPEGFPLAQCRGGLLA